MRRSAGGPDSRLTQAQLVAKFLGNAGDEAAAIVPLFEGLDSLDSLDPVFTAIESCRLP
ncbi:MAG TPA: hypothetical protein VFD59_02905 [Nocardioidaceae bacterium]|nr:hypothetical protein [Nocardioidaceae bacterium]